MAVTNHRPSSSPSGQSNRSSSSSNKDSKGSVSRRSSATLSIATSVATSASSGPAISVDGISAADIETTVEWAMMTETISMPRIRTIDFKAGGERRKDLLLLNAEDSSCVKHTNFQLSADRFEFERLLNIMRLSKNEFGIEDLQDKAKRDFLARFPCFSHNSWGCQVETPYIPGKGQTSRRSSQTPITNVAGTAEWYGKQGTKTARIEDVVDDDHRRYLLIRTEKGDVHSRKFLSDEDRKVLANLKNIKDYLPKYWPKAKAKFLHKYSAVEYNEGYKKLVVSADYVKPVRKTPKKTLNQYRFSKGSWV